MLRIVSICVALLCVSALAAPLDADSKHESSHEHELVAANHELLRPSPINPAIPSEPRPADRLLSTKVTPEDLKQHDHHKRQIIADTQPGVLIPIKKSGEGLYPEAKEPGGFSPNHRHKEKQDENKKTKRETEEHSLPKEKNPVLQSAHHIADLKTTQSHVPVGHGQDKPENAHHLIKHEAEHTDNHKPSSSSESAAHHNAEHSKPPRAPSHQEPHNHDNAHRPARNPQVSSVASPAVHNTKSSEPEVPKASQALPADHGTAATNAQFQTKQTKRETENDEPIKAAGVKELPKTESAAPKESNQSPSYVHPVPVSQIIKNSEAAPISHAAQNAKQDE